MVYIYARMSPNEASQPPNPEASSLTLERYPPNRNSMQMPPANQKRGGKYQPPRRAPPGFNFERQPPLPPQGTYHYPPLPQAQSQPAPAAFESSQFLPEVEQQMFAGYPPQQQQFDPVMSHQYPPMPHQYPMMNFQQAPPNFETQQMMPPMDYMLPGAYGCPAHFVPPPVYSPENLVPFNGTVPPPNFGQNDNNDYPDMRFSPSPLSNGFNQVSEYFAGIPLQPFPLYIPSQKLPNQRRPNAIAIIDPVTGVDKLAEIYGAARTGPEQREQGNG